MKDEYPQEIFVHLENSEFQMGRIILTKNKKAFFTEVDIVQKDSKKILAHVAQLTDIDEKNEAIDVGLQAMANFLKKPENLAKKKFKSKT